MRYYRLYMADSQGLICDRSEVYDFAPERLFEGRRVEDWDERITFWYEQGEVEDYLPNDRYWLVVSTKMRSAMERAAPGQAQYLPVQVRQRATGEPLEGYFVVNLLHRIAAFDWDRAKYEITTSTHMTRPVIFRHALVGEAAAPFDMFRLAEDELTVIISERVRVALGAVKVTGCSYTKIPVN